MKRRLSMMVLSVTLVAVVAFGIPLGFAVRRLYLNEQALRLANGRPRSAAIQDPSTFQI